MFRIRSIGLYYIEGASILCVLEPTTMGTQKFAVGTYVSTAAVRHLPQYTVWTKISEEVLDNLGPDELEKILLLS
jgi:hypothetical protein